MSVTSIQQRNGAPCENCGNPKCVGGCPPGFKAIEERLVAAEKACVDRVAQVAFGEVCARCTRRGCHGSACAPCDHCGGEIGPDITGRPCCYRCCSKSEELRSMVPADKRELLPDWMNRKVEEKPMIGAFQANGTNVMGQASPDPIQAKLIREMCEEIRAEQMGERGPGIAALKLPAPCPTLDMSDWTDETDLLPDAR